MCAMLVSQRNRVLRRRYDMTIEMPYCKSCIHYPRICYSLELKNSQFYRANTLKQRQCSGMCSDHVRFTDFDGYADGRYQELDSHTN